jgi:tetratricopeptide (TPR) repeat protein
MAFDKAKALQEAYKYVAQGKTAKAIKHYESVVEKDPGDSILLNVIGDLYAQENNIPEALRYFYKLADAYTREGYKVKAIAIYKKIAKIDQDNVEPLLRLAELNSAQGLAREAREHYKNALDFFERKGQKEQALEILRQLCRLDPKNHGLRLNLAQRVEDSGQRREAAGAYLSAAVLARENGDIAACKSALDKASELAPENSEINLFRARQALADRKPEEIGDILGSVPALRSSPEAKRLLLESYLATNNLDVASGLLLDVLESNPSNFAPAADFTSRCIEKGEFDTAFEILKGAAPFLIARRETGPYMETLVRLCKSFPDRTDILEFIYEIAEKTADEARIPEILEALGDAYAQSDQLERAEQAFARLVTREPENEIYKDLLRKVIEKQGKKYVPLSRTPLMNSDVGLESGPAPAQLEGPGNLSLGAEQVPAGAGPMPFPEETGFSPAAGMSDLSPQTVEFNLSQPANGQDVREDESELPPPQELSLDFQSPLKEKSGPGSAQACSSAESAPQQGAGDEAQTSDAQLSFDHEEIREEIEFYLRHGFHQEAQKAVTELERKYPGEGRVSELRQRVDQASRESNNAEETQVVPTTSKRERGEAEWDLPTSFFESASDAVRGQEDRMPFESGPGGGRVGLMENLPAELVSKSADLSDPEMSPASPVTQAGNDGGPGSVLDASAELGSLLDELKDANDSVDQAADNGETHYNLGVAFREMGLLDEAIGEFQKVVNGTGSKHFGPHFLQGCTLLASCFMDKEMPAIAAKWYLRALDAPGLDHEGAVAIYYDLGVAFEKAGDTTAALEKFTEVYSQNIDYRDVADKINCLRKTSR